LRISFLGGGTDFPEYFRENKGCVLGTAIDKFAYVTIVPYRMKFHEYKYKIAYSRIENTNSLDNIKHPVFRECIREIVPDEPLEIHYIADIPAQTGLGSSSTFVAAMILALHAFNNSIISPEKLAKESIRIEREILNEAGGWQDQIFAVYGGINYISFGPGNNFAVTPLPLSMERVKQIESYCLIVYTGIKRNSCDVHKDFCLNKEKKSFLDELFKLTVEGKDCLLDSGNLEKFGEILNEGWKLKKHCSEVSLPVIDDFYQKALKNGALGGKLLGAGKGGFLLLWAHPEKHETILKGMPSNFRKLDVNINAPGTSIIHYMES